MPFRSYGGPQLSRQKQIVSPRKQIASRQKQTAYGKSKLEMAKATLLRQKQIRNGKSKFVTAKANWKCNSQLVKVESKVVAAKANCTLRKCQTADKLRKSFRTKAKLNRHQSKIEQNQWGKAFWLEKQKAYDKSKLVISLKLITSQKQTLFSQKHITFASRESNNSYLGSLSIHSEGLGVK